MRSQRSQPDLRSNSNILEQRNVGKAERQSPAKTKTPVIAAVTRLQQQQMSQLSVDNGMKTPRSDSALASPQHQQQRPPPTPTLTPRPYRRPSLVALPMPQSTIQLLQMLRNGVDLMKASPVSPAQEKGGGGGGGQTVSELARSRAGRCTPTALIVPQPASCRPSSASLTSHPASRASAVHSPRSNFFGKMQQLHERQDPGKGQQSYWPFSHVTPAMKYQTSTVL